MTRKLISALSILIVTMALSDVGLLGVASAQEAQYPSKPIKLVLHAAAGDAMDITYRPLCKATEKILGQPIMVVNTPGAGGTRALSAILKEKPDGYTLATIAVGSIIATRTEKLGYTVVDDFTPVIQIQGHPMPFSVKRDAAWKTWQDFIKYAREHKGEAKVAVWGAKSLGWLVLQRIAKKENVGFIYVPLSGTGEATSSVLGGHVDATMHGGATMYSKPGGELKMLMVFSDQRLKDLPDVPTAREIYGSLSMGIVGGTSGIVAPKGLSGSLAEKIYDAIKKATEDPEYQKMVERMNVTVSLKNPEEYKKSIKGLDEEIKEAL